MSAVRAADPFVPEPHDHGRCIHDAMAQAASLCAARGARLTELRRRVLEIVWQNHSPVGAYQILERLAAERGRVAPPTVYRALDFLTGEGLVHRIDSLNAYIGCSTPESPHEAYFLICRRCGDAAEFLDAELAAALRHGVDRVGFRADTVIVELVGLCGRCTAGAPTP